MNSITFYPYGSGAALRQAGMCLSEKGVDVALSPSEDVTHLLLPVPSFDEKGCIRGGGNLARILGELPSDITIIGGNLDHPLLNRYKCIDLLKDAGYVAENAAITADCALRIAGANLPTVFRGTPMLVIGWGRIGKCLARMLKDLGADVAVAARKEADIAILRAMGYRTEYTGQLNFSLMRYRIIFNTVPHPVLSESQRSHCRPDCILIDLASQIGIAGEGVIAARGLPGKDAPEASGTLIAKAALRLAREKEAGI